MKKYVIGIKDDQLNIGLLKVSGKKTKILDEASIQHESMGRLIDTCSLNVSEELQTELEAFLVKTKHKSKKIDVVIGLDSIISRTIEIPFIKKKDLEEYLENNITTFFTVNMNEYYYDYKVLDIIKKNKEEKKKLSVMIVAIPVPIVKGIINLTESLGLSLTATKIYPDIMLNVASKGENIAIFDMGPKKGLITIYENGTTFLYTSVNTEIDVESENPFDDFAEEVEYFTDFYSSRHQGEKLDSIYIFGEYQNNEEFANYIQERLGTKVSYMDYKSNRKYANKTDIDKYPQMVISQIRKKEIFNSEIDFINENRLYNKEPFRFKPLHLFLILLLLTGGWSGGYYYYLDEQAAIYNKEPLDTQEYIEIETEVNELSSELSTYVDKEEAVNEIVERQFDYNEILAQLYEATPEGVTLASLVMSQEVVSVKFNIPDETMVAVNLIVAINDLDYFEEVGISDLSLDNQLDSLSLELTVQNEGGE